MPSSFEIDARPTAGSPSRGDRRRIAGGVVVPALLLLIVIAGGLGWNYQRNYQIEKAQEQNRPFARYSTESLSMMVEGYRQELAAASGGQEQTRVATRDRHHFGDQVKEFERVQQATRKIRDRAIEVAQIQSELADLEAEQQLRASAGGGAMIHVKRAFKI